MLADPRGLGTECLHINLKGISSHFVLADPWWLGTQCLHINLKGISSHFMLADPWWLGTQCLPESIALRLIAFLILVILHKQACDAALNEKSLPPSYRGRLCDSDWIIWLYSNDLQMIQNPPYNLNRIVFFVFIYPNSFK